MALMTCPECKKEVSTTAQACPYCGAKVTPPMGIVTAFVIVGLVVAVIVMVTVSSCSESSKPKKTSEQSAAETKRYVVAVSATKAIRESMRDPDSLEYDALRVNDDASVVCAKYRARNGFGGVNRELMVITGKGASQTPDDWNEHCTQPMYDMNWAAQ